VMYEVTNEVLSSTTACLKILEAWNVYFCHQQSYQ
jgi:hypothetical protein